MKKKLITAAILAALGSAGTASAAPGVLFDPSGAGGGGIATTTFSWINNVALAASLFPDGSAGTIYGMGTLVATAGPGGANPVPSGRFTYQFAIPTASSVVSLAGNPLLIVFDASAVSYGAGNYFRMYYDPTPSFNTLTGTGFGDSDGTGARNPLLLDAGQKLILDGKMTISSSGANFTITSNGQTDLDSGGGNNPRGTVTINGSGNLTFDINVCQTSGEPAPAQCVAGASTIDSGFFRSDISSFTMDLTLADGIKTPFDATANVTQKINNVTPQFGDGTTNGGFNDTRCGIAPDTGVAPCDMLYFGTGATMSTLHSHEVVPEPVSLLLFGIGLGGLGFMNRRRKAQVA